MTAKAIGLLVSVLSLAEPVFAEDKPAKPTKPRPMTIYIDCSAIKQPMNYCPTYTVGHVKLVRQFSKARCKQYDSWGATGDGSGIWVQKGCRGTFIVERGRPYSQEKPTTLTCKSENHAYAHCATPMWGRRAFVEKPLGPVECKQGENWGADWNGVWVNANCAADFGIQ